MNEKELLGLIKKGESGKLEFKSKIDDGFVKTGYYCFSDTVNDTVKSDNYLTKKNEKHK